MLAVRVAELLALVLLGVAGWVVLETVLAGWRDRWRRRSRRRR